MNDNGETGMIKAFKENKVFIFVFFMCFAYWTYLFFTSSASIVYDAVEYESLGELIYKKGWVEFFRIGPNREPLYPLSIAMSMCLADMLNVPYQKIQTFFQILILCSVQILAWKLMTVCFFKKWIKLLAVFYLGFSPAIVNAGFSLFSEILAMPFVLLIVIFAARFWKEVQTPGRNKRVVLTSIGLSFAFIGALCVKAVFQYIFYFFIVIFLMGAIGALLQNRKEVMKKIILGSLIMAALAGGFINGYKYMNKVSNGEFDFTDRYHVILFGTAYKRVQPLSRDVWSAHFASILGNKFCESIVNKEACLYPQFFYADAVWPVILPPLLVGIPEDKAPSKIVQLSFEEIRKNPIQYFFLTYLESLKMAFWESTQIGFVHYPRWLNQLFLNKLFKDGIRLVIALLTYAGLFLVVLKIIKPRRKPPEFNSASHATPVLFCIFCIILSFTALYSMFAIMIRYALPIAPLYVICIAYFFDRTLGGSFNGQKISLRKRREFTI